MQHSDDSLIGLPGDYVIGDEWLYGLLSSPANWGIALMGVQRLRDAVKKSSVVVGVVDTGVDYNHPDLAGRVIEVGNFSPENDRDNDGHGSHVAGTIASSNPNIGINPAAKIVSAKCLWGKPRPSGTSTAIANGIDFCASKNAAIINASIGSSAADGTIRAAIVRFIQRGGWFVAAAGNSGGNTSNVDYPARWEESVATASLDEALNVSSFSNRGAKIDAAAPGSNIWSCKPGGGYFMASGTSMATPFLVGMLSLYRDGLVERGRPIPTALDLRLKLVSMARDVHTPGVDNRTGPGAIWPLLLANDLEPDAPPVSR